jgi:hypothetical protein
VKVQLESVKVQLASRGLLLGKIAKVALAARELLQMVFTIERVSITGNLASVQVV